jgi:hypothetical protein
MADQAHLEEKPDDEVTLYLRGIGNRLALLLIQGSHYPSKQQLAERIIQVLISDRKKNRLVSTNAGA